ncbi:MAG: MmgE/PrpD family protein [Novosphingobium sp.]|nr:MmgE/PrpD family protein [Novosphingobium sp.]
MNSAPVAFKYVEDRGAASAERPVEMTAIAEHVATLRYDDIPPDTVAKAKLRILDLVGCALGGKPGNGNEALVRCLDAMGSAPRASVIGFDTKLSAGDAALANAVIARSYDFEVMTVIVGDIAIGSHNSPTTCMTALALAEERSLSGRDFLTALIMGDDVAARMLAASGLDLGAGWDASSIFTVIPAAAIAAKLMGLDAERSRDAMGHAVEMISGTTQSVWDGIPAWKLVGGLAAKNGIFAAQLAATGAWPAVGDALRSGYGFFGQFTTGCLDPDILTRELGQTFFAEEYFKPYPSCAATQAMMECALELSGGEQFLPEQIASLTVRVPEFVLGTALALPFAAARDDHTRANFSIRYQIANAILRGRTRQEHYAPTAIRSPDVAAILERLELAPLPAGTRGVEAEMTLADGRRLQASHTGVTWRHPQRQPSTERDVLDKFHEQVAFSGASSAARADEIAQRVLSLEGETNMAELAALLAAPGR